MVISGRPNPSVRAAAATAARYYISDFLSHVDDDDGDGGGSKAAGPRAGLAGRCGAARGRAGPCVVASH